MFFVYFVVALLVFEGSVHCFFVQVRPRAWIRSSRVLNSNEEFLERIIKSKDETIASKIETVAIANAAKDEIVRANAETIRVLKENIRQTQQSLLRSEGLLTGRGLVEWLLKKCHNLMNPASPFVATKTTKKLDALVAAYKGNGTVAEDDFVKTFVTFAADVDVNYEKLYRVLSDKIHSFLWQGMRVKLLVKDLSQSEIALIKRVAEELDLEVDEAVEEIEIENEN